MKNERCLVDNRHVQHLRKSPTCSLIVIGQKPAAFNLQLFLDQSPATSSTLICANACKINKNKALIWLSSVN